MTALAVSRRADPPTTREERAIELHRFELDHQSVSALHDLLSPEERERARRLRFARDADRFIVGRGMVRRALAARVGCHPAELRIAAGPVGKPFLPDHPEVRFNASGSGGVGLLAIGCGIELGVDLELAEHGFDGLGVARQFFREREIAALESLQGADRAAAFLRCWTRKEAYVKALGHGLQAELDSFEVSLLPGEPAELRWCAVPGELERWTLVDCSALAGGATEASAGGATGVAGGASAAPAGGATGVAGGATAALCYETRPGAPIRVVGAGR